jgi:hypothetical protein
MFPEQPAKATAAYISMVPRIGEKQSAMFSLAPIPETNQMHISRLSSLVLIVAASSIAFVEPDQNSKGPQSETRPDTQDGNSRQDRTPQTPDEHQPITLPEGTVIPVRIADDVSSKHDRPGELFSGTVDPSVLINDIVVIPRGTEAHIRMVHRKKGGHIHGKAEITLELVSLIMNGQRLEVDSDVRTKKKGAASAKSSAIAKKGENSGAAAVGGDPAAAAGPVIAAFTAAKAEVKAGSRIEFRLESPFTFEKPPINHSDQH